jgi:hypothetical protein
MKMTDRYIIEPEINSKFFPEKIEVIFAETLDAQSITTCLLRNKLVVIGFGWAIENPNDDWVLNGGYSWAYKRAIRSMTNNLLKNKNTSHGFRKEIDRKMRQALYDIRKNENGK